MSVYVVAGIEERIDPELMGKYSELASPTVAAHGGKFVARGPIKSWMAVGTPWAVW